MKFKGTKLSKRTVALLAAAVVMLGSGGVMGAKAAPNITALRPYDATLNLNSVSIDITENGNVVSYGALTLTNDKTLSIGKKYTDTIGVQNNGAADEYVRVIVRRYWTDSKGKRVDLAPDLIELTAAEGWTPKAVDYNDEYTVYYLSSPLKAGDSKDLFTNFRISEDVKIKGKKIMINGEGDYATDEDAAANAGDGDVITYTYTYNGVDFNVEAEAQSVQTHSSEQAIRSVWGVNPSDVGITDLVD
jgi:hypothetical protein